MTKALSSSDWVPARSAEAEAVAVLCDRMLELGADPEAVREFQRVHKDGVGWLNLASKWTLAAAHAWRAAHKGDEVTRRLLELVAPLDATVWHHIGRFDELRRTSTGSVANPIPPMAILAHQWCWVMDKRGYVMHSRSLDNGLAIARSGELFRRMVFFPSYGWVYPLSVGEGAVDVAWSEACNQFRAELRLFGLEV